MSDLFVENQWRLSTVNVMTVQVLYSSGLDQGCTGPPDLNNVILHFQVTAEDFESRCHQPQLYRVIVNIFWCHQAKIFSMFNKTLRHPWTVRNTEVPLRYFVICGKPSFSQGTPLLHRASVGPTNTREFDTPNNSSIQGEELYTDRLCFNRECEKSQLVRLLAGIAVDDWM